MKPLGQRRSTRLVGVLLWMKKLQRLANLAIIGSMKSTLTDLLDAHAGLFPTELTLLYICHRATTRLCTLPATHPLHPLVCTVHGLNSEKHQDPIKTVLRIFELDPWKFESILLDLTPLATLSRIVPTISRNWEDSILAVTDNTSDYTVYTDGSGLNRKASMSAVLYKRGEPHMFKSLNFHLGNLSR